MPGTYKPLTRDQQRELCARRDAGDEAAAWELAASVFPLARKLTAKFCRRCHWDDFDAAYSAACRGAHRAATKLDPAVSSITTYAHAWIRQFLHREWLLLAGGAIWVPINARDGACEFHEDAQRAGFVLSFQHEGDGQEGGNPNVQAIDDRDPAEIAARNERQAAAARAVHATLAAMPERLAVVLRRRKMHGETLEAIGVDLGVSKERVRQLEANAVREFLKHYHQPIPDPENETMSDTPATPSVSALVDQLTPEALAAELEELERQYAQMQANYKARQAKLKGLLKAIGGGVPKPKRSAGGSRGDTPREGTISHAILTLLQEQGPLKTSDIALAMGRTTQQLSGNLSQCKGKYWDHADGKWSAIVPAAA